DGFPSESGHSAVFNETAEIAVSGHALASIFQTETRKFLPARTRDQPLCPPEVALARCPARSRLTPSLATQSLPAHQPKSRLSLSRNARHQVPTIGRRVHLDGRESIAPACRSCRPSSNCLAPFGCLQRANCRHTPDWR